MITYKLINPVELFNSKSEKYITIKDIDFDFNGMKRLKLLSYYKKQFIERGISASFKMKALLGKENLIESEKETKQIEYKKDKKPKNKDVKNYDDEYLIAAQQFGFLDEMLLEIVEDFHVYASHKEVSLAGFLNDISYEEMLNIGFFISKEFIFAKKYDLLLRTIT